MSCNYETYCTIYGLLSYGFGSPEGSRTLHCAVRGRRLNRLTTGPYDLQVELYVKMRYYAI